MMYESCKSVRFDLNERLRFLFLCKCYFITPVISGPSAVFLASPFVERLAKATGRVTEIIVIKQIRIKKMPQVKLSDHSPLNQSLGQETNKVFMAHKE